MNPTISRHSIAIDEFTIRDKTTHVVGRRMRLCSTSSEVSEAVAVKVVVAAAAAAAAETAVAAFNSNEMLVMT